MAPSLRKYYAKCRKDLADMYRRIRRDGKGPLAKLMWRQYREAEKKLTNHILFGTPLE